MAGKPVLYAVTGRARKCGPSAIAAVLGCSTDDAAAMLRRATGAKQVHNVFIEDVAYALKAAGRDCLVHSETSRTTLNQWAREHRAEYKDHPAIVLYGGGKHTGHFGTFLNGHYMCSRTGYELVPISDLPNPTARVKSWLIVRLATTVNDPAHWDRLEQRMQTGSWK